MAEMPDTPSVRGGNSLQSISRIVIEEFIAENPDTRAVLGWDLLQ